MPELSFNIVWFIVIGIVAGWLAGQFMKGSGFGLIGDFIIGILGAIVGGFLFSMAGFPPFMGILGNLIVATVGAVVLLLLVHLVKRNR